jgi:hypothetical protein
MRLAFALLMSPLAAHAETIDAKPGLWERTVTMQQQMAMPSLPDLSALSPAQRAQMERTMAAMSGKPTTSRECVTPAMLEKWEDFQKDPQQASDCTHQVLESTPRSVRMAVTCQDGATTGTMQFTAASPERIDGTIDMVHRKDGVERPMKMTIASRWLGSDCESAPLE